MSQPSDSLKLQDAAAATGNGAAMNVTGRARLGLQLTGTFVATVTFEATIDGATWVALALTPAGGGAAVTTATAPGLLAAAVSGFSQFRARISAYTSGSITVLALATDAAA